MANRKSKSKPLRFVQTTLGNCILPALARTIVNISGNVYLEKEVRDLSPGEMVLFRKEGIDKTLEEVEPYLEKSLRYREANDALHVTSGEGRITRFRNDLVSGLEELVDVRGSFHDKLFKVDGEDFTSEEYSDMVRVVFDAVKKDERVDHDYARTTIKSWLRGETLAPRDWTVFEILADAGLSDELRNYGKPKSEGGLRDHYKLYTVVRQGIMRYLSTKGSEAIRVSGSEEEDGEGISLRPEVNFVLEEFMEDVDRTHSLARVVGVEQLRERDVPKKIERVGRKLSKGIETDKPDDFEGGFTSYCEVLRDKGVVDCTFQFMLARYFCKMPRDRFSELAMISQTDVLERSRLFLHFLLRERKPSSQPGEKTEDLLDYLGEPETSIVGAVSELHQKIVDGSVDRALGVKTGLSSDCYKVLLRLLDVFPDSFLLREERASQSKLVGEYSRRQSEEDAIYFKRRFGIEKNHRRGFSHNFLLTNVYDLPLKLRWEQINDLDYMVSHARRAMPYLEFDFYTRDEVQARLDNYCLGDLMGVIPPTVFVHEQLEAEPRIAQWGDVELPWN